MQLKDIKRVFRTIKENPYISNKELLQKLEGLTRLEINEVRKILSLNGYIKKK